MGFNENQMWLLEKRLSHVKMPPLGTPVVPDV
jgi:hypothetical protein